MQNLPIAFDVTDVVVNPTLHLSYNFDIISSIQVNTNSALDIDQTTPIQAVQIELAGKTSNPNISVSMDATTRLFTLNTIYLTDTYPYMKGDNPGKCLVIEGFSLENVNREKVLLFLPMQPTSTTKNKFNPLEMAIVNLSNVLELDLNSFIPSIDITKDYYSYYKHTDNAGCLFHIVFFHSSSLGYTNALQIPTNPPGYESEEVRTVNQCKTLAVHHTNMDNQYEDNIYIDCVPVDLVNQTDKKYMQIGEGQSTYLLDMLITLVYMIVLSLIVYGIYSFYIYNTKPPAIVKPVKS